MQATKYKIIRTWEELKKLPKFAKTTGYCAFDFETTGTRITEPEELPTIVGLSFQPGSAFIVPLAHKESPFKDEYQEVLKFLSDYIFKDTNIVKVAHNAKFEHKWLLKYYSDMRGRVFDTMLAKHLLDEEKPHGLKEITARLLPEFAHYDDEVKMLVKKYGWDGVPLEELSHYCSQDADYTLRLMMIMEPMLIKHNFYKLFRNMLMMAHRVLMETEFKGMKVDIEYLEALKVQYGEELDQIQTDLYNNKVVKRFENATRKEHFESLLQESMDALEELEYELEKEEDPRKKSSIKRKISNLEAKQAKYIQGNSPVGISNDQLTKKEQFNGFNFASPKQLIQLLYEHDKGFKCPIIEKSKTGNAATDEATLKKLLDLAKECNRKHLVSLLEGLLGFRARSTIYKTFINGMLEQAGGQEYIHCNYKIHGTVTGRLSSAEPNLQNIPRGTTAKGIKSMFIPPKGYLLMEVDYSQAELRVVAEVANDKGMIDIFKRGYNIHIATGLKMFGLFDDETYQLANTARKDPNHPDKDKWTRIHKAGKQTNFAILYGQSDMQMAKALGVSDAEAHQFKENWFKQFPQVTKWIEKQKKFVEKNGFVYTLWGRKRRLPDALRKNERGAKKWYEKALRESINAPIQGASNDFTLFSSIIMREKKLSGELPWDLHQCYTVHDSLGFWVQPKDIHKVAPILLSICANPETEKYFGFKVKHVNMKVSVEVGKSWGGLEEYMPDFDYSQWLKDDDYVYNRKQLKN